MKEFLLDANVIIGLWKEFPVVIDKLIEEKRIKVIKEICEELVIKERREYRSQELLSERFCKLLSFIQEVNSNHSKEFTSILDRKHLEKGNTDFNDLKKLSKNDLLLIYACYVDNNLILVTEDKSLFNIANHIIGQNRVITLKTLVGNVI